MENRYTTESLKEAIKVLEAKQAEKGKILKEQLVVTYERLKPSNILRNVLAELTSSEALKDEIINTAISISSGYFTRKFIVRKSSSQTLKLIGLAIQLGITTLVSRKYEAIKESVIRFVHRFIDNDDKKEDTSS